MNFNLSYSRGGARAPGAPGAPPLNPPLRCKAAMFDLWLRRNPKASWDIVASALEQAGEAVLASDIRKRYLSTDSDSPLPTDQIEGGDGFSPFPETRLTLDLEKDTVKKFTKLESKFAVIVSNVRSALIRKVTPTKLHGFLEVRLDQEMEFCSTTSITDLFRSISPYYCFLNITLLWLLPQCDHQALPEIG